MVFPTGSEVLGCYSASEPAAAVPAAAAAGAGAAGAAAVASAAAADGAGTAAVVAATECSCSIPPLLTWPQQGRPACSHD